MDSLDLTREQLERLHARIAPTLGYLSKLKQRMHDERFPEGDNLYVATIDAQDAMQSLAMAIHYLICRESTGHPSTQPEKPR